MSTPMRRIRSGCCARTASGHTAALPTSPMTPRLFKSRMESRLLPAGQGRQPVRQQSVYRSLERLTGRSARPWGGP